MKKFIFIFCFLASPIFSFANTPAPEKTVNAVAFYGFLEDPRIGQAVEDQCHVKFSHDAYYTNADFLNAFNKHPNSYDVMIFSNLIYGSIKNQLPDIPTSNLWESSSNYYPYLKEYYLTHDYTHNTAFFTHAIVGFMYNPKLITITPNESMSDIFKSAKNHTVVLVDDSGEIGNLLTTGFKNSPEIPKNKDGTVSLTYDNLKRMTQGTKVFITSDFNKIYDSPDFAFSYIWSGDALLYIKSSGKPYKFVIPSNASSICTDLIVQMKDTPEAACAARVMQSQPTLKYFEEDTYYFSPYFKNNMNDPSYTSLYNQTGKILPKLQMIQPVSNFQKEYNNQWDLIKLKVDHDDNP